MKPAVYLLPVALLLAAATFKASILFDFQKQVDVNITPPISLCGQPGARAILQLMDTTQQMAPLLNNLGSYGMPVSTQNARAQQFFNQGLNLYYGFNHLEAYRSFKEAARLDPNLAMAYWGQALCLGPNINLPMDPADTETVYKAIQRAKALLKNGSAREQELINALAQRYTSEALKDRKPLDEAYASAMRQVANLFPDDQDVNTLFAEALMDLHPWDFWKNGNAQPWTTEPVSIIASVIAKNKNHPGANHLNIHLLEASPDPDRAAASADRLTHLVPGSGHLVHMPSHIYIRLGRYVDGVRANEQAVKTDEEYIVACKVQGVYPLFYYPHNYHFLLACAQMAGMQQKSVETAEALQRTIPTGLLTNPNFVTLQHWYVMPWYNLARFGQWEKIMQIQDPTDSLKYAKAVWHYVRGMAFLRTNRVSEAQHELVALKKWVADPFMENTISGFNSFKSVLSIGAYLLEGELAASHQKYDEAIAAVTEAKKIEDGLLYQEPPDWYLPTRQVLGAMLLQAKRPADAEKFFREDLHQYRANGWSLMGLHQSLLAQNKKKEAAVEEQKLKKAFGQSDLKIFSSRF
jgi:tetratricopeptide (TPR) repeat protein